MRGGKERMGREGKERRDLKEWEQLVHNTYCF